MSLDVVSKFDTNWKHGSQNARKAGKSKHFSMHSDTARKAASPPRQSPPPRRETMASVVVKMPEIPGVGQVLACKQRSSL